MEHPESAERPQEDQFGEIVGGGSPGPFAAVGLLCTLLCALAAAVSAGPVATQWWVAAGILAAGSVTLAAFSTKGLPE